MASKVSGSKRPANPVVQVNVPLPNDLRDRLRSFAKREGRVFHRCIRQACEEFLQRQEKVQA